MQASYTASRCMQKIHQLQVVCREEHVGGAHPKKNKKRKPRADELGSGLVVRFSHQIAFGLP
jgi:hypothetical protein